MLELTVILLVFAVGAAASIWKGYVVSIMWGWFMVPLGAPSIGIAMAIGVALIVSMLTHQYRKTESIELWPSVGEAFLGPLLTLGFGWVIRQYI